MKNFVRCLFGVHDWKVLQVYDMEGYDKKVGVVYILQCQKCGKVKTLNVRTFIPYETR